MAVFGVSQLSLLDGEIRSLFASVFGSIYDDGTLISVTLVADGFGGYSETVSTQSVKVQRDTLTERQRLELGFAPTDVAIIVLRGPAVNTNDRVTAYGETYTIGPTVTTDPGNSHWICRGIRNG